MSSARVKKRPANLIKDRERIFDIQDYLKYYSQRNYVLFILGISTGYRCGDLVRLKVRDIKQVTENGYFEVLDSKKGNSKNIRRENIKPRRVKLIDNLRLILNQYISERRDYEYMFQSRKGRNQYMKGMVYY